jgi:hypothetical protein
LESVANTEPLWRRLLAHARARVEQLKSEHASPTRLGWAIFVGVMCGCSPLLGFQFLAALALAWIFRLNKLAVMIGLQISAPPLTPFFIVAELELGELIRHGHLLTLSFAQLRAMPTRELLRLFFIDLTVGGVVAGVVLGALLGAATSRFIRNRRARER